MKRKIWKRAFFVFGLMGVVCAVLFGHPVYHLARTYLNDRDDQPSVPPGKANDASRLDETSVAQTWKIPDDEAEAEKQLAGLLQYARTNHLKISIAGARHSMGGHTIYPGGIVVDMLPFSRMSLDENGGVLHVEAGARWSEVIQFLNAHGFSVEVMQSNDDFSIGGSLSVNCHGWQFNRPPIDCTVLSFRLMRADGTVVKCSRSENQELFSLALGGYGLFGIILDADLRVMPNETYRIERVAVSSADYAKVLAEKTVDTNDVAMVYGRLRVTEKDFLKDGVINVFHRQPGTNRLTSNLDQPQSREIQRLIFRGGVGSDYGKELRWDAERYFSSTLAGDVFERNMILYEPSAWFSEHSSNRTDILVECFVPPAQFEPLLVELRKILPENKADLLNVTVRDIDCDQDSFMRYADTNMLSLVMLFVQDRDQQGEEKMAELTREIVAAALRHEGRYYLPYRLHATPEQFNQAYPQAAKFFELKRKYDPDELFQNSFYQKYGH